MKKILILASNPRRDLRLDREIRDLKKAVERSIHQSQFAVEIELAVRPGDLQELFLHHKPCIVNFCGHSLGEPGLVFEDEAGKEQIVGTEAIANLFQLFAAGMDCVLLNTCHSEVQAEVIVQHIDYVIGIRQGILDSAAYFFAIGFYRGLGYGESIERSFELGCNAIELQILPDTSRKLEPLDPIAPALPEHLKPVLRKRTTSDRPSISFPAEFAAAIAQESNLKRYQDRARASWDGIGRSPIPSQPLTEHEYRQRRVFVGKVKEFWIEGFLKRSLVGEAIELGLQARPDAVQRPFAEIPAELDQPFEQLQNTSLFEQIGQGKTLLILGEPGAGKTIALLKLAERLVEQTDLSQPMPVVLNLASWASRRQPIADWLVEELREKYQVPKALSKPWIGQEHLILLLDGLDEVKAEYRNDCVRSLNQFIETHSVTDLVVCSRVRDYEALSEQLKLSSAICLQPLTAEQVDRFLATNDSLTGLRSLIQQDAELEAFAQTPLILNIMSSAYADWSIESLIQQFSVAENRYEHFFDTYIDRMLGRRSLPYPREKILQWLRWLAKQMMREGAIIFLIERIQPSWLESLSEKKLYRVRNALVFGLIFGLIFGLFGSELFGGLVSWLFGGLIFGLIVGLSVKAEKRIYLVDTINWSWQQAKEKVEGLLFGQLCMGLLLGTILGLIYRLILGLSVEANLELIIRGLLYVLLIGVSFGLVEVEVEQRIVPNQGITSSANNCIVIGLICGLTFGLVAGLSYGLCMGLNFGFGYGGITCIENFNLRLILYRADRIPWNYARFLDFASDRLLLKKVGGGYLFYHRMLMEHLAQQ